MTPNLLILSPWKRLKTFSSALQEEVESLRRELHQEREQNAALRAEIQHLRIRMMDTHNEQYFARTDFTRDASDDEHTIATYHLYLQGRTPDGRFRIQDGVAYAVFPSKASDSLCIVDTKNSSSI
jgi:regulator of replication initiation timing